MTKEMHSEKLQEELTMALACLNEKEFNRARLGKIIHDLRNLATPITMIAELLKMEKSPVPIETLHDDLMETLTYLTAAVDELQECRKADPDIFCDPNSVLQDYRTIFEGAENPINLSHEAGPPCEINMARMNLIQMILCAAGASPDGGEATADWELSTQQDDDEWALVLVSPGTKWPDEFITKLTEGRIGWHDSYSTNWMTLQFLVASGRGKIAVDSVDDSTRCAISFKKS
jgi:hypothetical protein